MIKGIQLHSLGLLILICACNAGPPLRVIATDAGVEIDVSTLGEYPTTIGGLRISNAETGEILLALTSDGQTRQIWSFELKPGENRLPIQMEPPDALYDVIAPAATNSFFLEQDVSYRVEVWGADPAAQSETVFALGATIGALPSGL